MKLPEFRITRNRVTMDIILYSFLKWSLYSSRECALIVSDIIIIQDKIIKTGGIINLCQSPANPQHNRLWSCVLLIFTFIWQKKPAGMCSQINTSQLI